MILTILLWGLALPVSTLFVIFCAEAWCGQFRTRLLTPLLPTSVTTTILMPAHNEASGIAATLSALRATLEPDIQILVVADNCSDDTASVARATGATVIERHNPDFRGKGYALAFGRDHLRSAPPDVVMVLDADCLPQGDCACTLISAAFQSGRPVQATNLIIPDRSASALVQISSFAFLVKNFVRQRGLARLGPGAVLTGTGMAFPWNIFAAAPLATGNIVEDLALGVTLARQGIRPLFVESAKVLSAAASDQAMTAQRSRWEHGFIATAGKQAIPLITQGLAGLRWPLVWLGLHLLVPPLALLFMIGGLVLGLLAVGTAFGGSALPMLTLLFAVIAAAGLTLLSWARFGQTTLAARTLISLPLYILWKVPVYLRLARGSKQDWTRTRRPGEPLP
jgi:cellulose synthase/poly-beta-1,6-N-acetylglucosamine synthase-like glycosyltransferase